MTDTLTPLAPTTTTDASTAAADQTGLADDFETFLTLLTTQLENQDPLSPMDSTEFVSQLVEFTSVEQQIKQNANLEDMIALDRTSAAASGVAFIGQAAAITGEEAELTAGAAAWRYTLDQATQRTDIVISNADGKVVFEAEGAQTVGEHRFTWDGRTVDGEPLPDGLYTAQITGQGPDAEIITTEIAGVLRVTGVDLSGDPSVIAGGAKRPFGDIVEVRAP